MASLGETFGINSNIALRLYTFFGGITMCTIWIEHSGMVFDQTQWHDTKVKITIVNECIP